MYSKLSGLGDFESTEDYGSAVNFGTDSGLCLSNIWTLGPERNLGQKFSFSLGQYINKVIQIISFSE